MRMLHGRYIGPLWSAPNGGDGGGGGSGSGSGGGNIPAPPSLPPAPAAAPTPATAPAPANQSSGQGQASPAPRTPRKRAGSQPKTGTRVTAGQGGVTVKQTGKGGSASATVHGPGDVIEAVSELPTPGGLVLLLAILILFLFAIVPVTPKGKTRLALLWDTLRGKTSLPAPSTSSAGQQPTSAQQSALQDAEAGTRAGLSAAASLLPFGGNAGGAGMVPSDAHHALAGAPVPESTAAAPTDGYGYLDAWEGPAAAPQPYYGETEWIEPVFPEIGG